MLSAGTDTALARVSSWLACPNCGAAMSLVGRTLGCERGHRFDVARQGYVNLLGRAAPANADTASMCDARERFLASGHYRPILDAIIPVVPSSAGRVVEVGAGTGWYLSGVLNALPDALGLASDVSPAAARRAARTHKRMASVVADTWDRLPLQPASVDALLCVFAPRNAVEFARVVRSGASVVVVVPGPGHLAELRHAHGLLDVGSDKLATVTESLLPKFEPAGSTVVRRQLDLSDDDATALVAMGPNAFHDAPDRVTGIKATLDVTVASFRRV